MEVKKQNVNNSAYKMFVIVGMSTAILLASPVLLLLLIGFFADNFFHTTPFYIFLGIGLGFISGIINVFRMVQIMQRKKKTNT
ncbi:MAG TPA: AtpZ/AtpI family protein [Candidatus Sulfotelmatobacter sp.]|jgi:F0F1-type ATP synthase assembly protein I|nr:AtpZ/AtpI family protein [Candidatus Sulfotelmatobacter sp.]